MRIGFIVPGSIETISGGYGYDRAMIAGLRSLGREVSVIELGGDARAVWAALPNDMLPVIDGLALRDFAPLAAEIAGRCCVGLIHHPISLEPDWNDSEKTDLAAQERALFPAFAKVIVTSDWTAKLLPERFGVAAEKIVVVQPGTAPASRTRFSEAGCEILALGSLEPRKGHAMLLRALARLWDLDWHLTLAGQGPDLENLQAVAADLKIADRVTMPGLLQGAALEAQWARTDVFALATRFEGFGMAIAEALARGIPPAITDGGAAGSLVPLEAGCVAKVDDQVTYSKMLRRMIFDTRVRKMMADVAWEFGQTLPDWPAQIARFAQALETV